MDMKRGTVRPEREKTWKNYETYEERIIVSLRSGRAVAGQRSSPDLCFVTAFIKIYDQLP